MCSQWILLPQPTGWEILCIHRPIGLIVRGFANCPGDHCSIPGWVTPNTQKIVLDAILCNTQPYKVWIKGKEEHVKARVKLGGFWFQLEAFCMSSKNEELWYNETVCLWMILYIYIYMCVCVLRANIDPLLPKRNISFSCKFNKKCFFSLRAF